MKRASLLIPVIGLAAIACSLLSGLLPAKTPGSPTETISLPWLSTPTPWQTLTPAPSAHFPSCQPVVVAESQALVAAFPTVTPTAYLDQAAPPLRALAEAHGIQVGASLGLKYLEDPIYARILRREYNIIIPEGAMSWDVIHPEAGRFDFSQADTFMNFAQAYGMAAYGHMLVWDYAYPDWLTQAEYSRDEWINLLCTHIKTIVSRYRGRAFAWLVVNEAFENNGMLRDTLWLRKIGPEYLAMAFQWAHEADPGALLVYNDHSAEGLNVKSQAIYALAQGFRQLGVPLHGIGMQMHTWTYGAPSSEELAANMQRLADLGLQVHITEMDVRVQYNRGSLPVKMDEQAETYRQAFAVCLAAPNCTVFITWGVMDNYSWIPWLTGKADAPLLFDDKGWPKPAYYAIYNLLSQP